MLWAYMRNTFCGRLGELRVRPPDHEALHVCGQSLLLRDKPTFCGFLDDLHTCCGQMGEEDLNVVGIWESDVVGVWESEDGRQLS